MPCGQKCKEILDSGRALIQAIGCMQNSIVLNAAAGGNGPSARHRQEFMDKASELALLAQRIATSLPLVDDATPGTQERE